MENNNPPVPPNPNENDINKQFNQQFGNTNPPLQNFNQPGQMAAALPPLPNATTSMVLGIIGLVMAVLWCYWITTTIGLVLSIIALITGNSSIKQYNANPGAFSASSLSNAKAGKIMGIIGLVISVLWFLFSILWLVFWAAAIGSMFRF